MDRSEIKTLLFPHICGQCGNFFKTKEDVAIAQAISKLKSLYNSSDTESAHCIADDALTDLLESIGLHEVVQAFKNVDKWYS